MFDWMFGRGHTKEEPMSELCDNCSSRRGVELYQHRPDPDVWLCQVCSRLYGTNRTGPASLSDINKNIVILFHTLGLIPHDTDDEAEDGDSS